MPTVPTVREELKAAFEGKTPVVRTIGATSQLLITTNYLAEVIGPEAEAADNKVREVLLAKLAKYGVSEASVLRSTKVGPAIARDIIDSAILAVLFSLIVIFLYIFARFQGWQFGVGALVSLTFNVLVVLGLFSILGMIDGLPISVEVNQPFIAALLTIVGYTINDTVIVFDRIREALRNDKIGRPIEELYNSAVNDTLSRTIVTSFTTFLTAFVLFVLGGEALQGFMLALMVGIVVGTLSSIFVASPISLDLIKRTYGKGGTAKEATVKVAPAKA
jgi:SecD/SecF fusion protein